MNGEINNRNSAHSSKLESRKGCPVCEHTDTDLERELQVFAQLLLDIHLAKSAKERPSDSATGIDNFP